MKLPIYQVDAFSSRLFSGNPAAVVPLEKWLPDVTMQAIALENNLAETAFFVPTAGKPGAAYDLRWFTPAIEVPLCGHATIASAHVLLRHMGVAADALHFNSKSGPLSVTRDGDWLVLDFPSLPPRPIEITSAVIAALGGARPDELHAARKTLAVYRSEAEVRALKPDFPRIAALDTFGLIVTAPGDDCDFVSRFFAPAAGVNEDPATGSSHCTLIPYWSARLGKQQLFARQVSPRGGEFRCRLAADRVHIGGQAVTYLTGEIEIA